MVKRKPETTQDAAQEAGITHQPCLDVINGLEQDIRALKKQLALRGEEPAMKGRIKHTGGATDWLDQLSEQDRAFFARKGIRK